MLLVSFFVFVIGACIGSFLNVCIYRLPRDLSLIKPRSFCPHCSKSIRWYDNIPLVSFLCLTGRCRFCKNKISFRYIFVEAFTALLSLLVWHNAQSQSLELAEILLRLLLTYALIVVSMVDLDLYIIPDEISYSYFFLAVALSILLPAHLGVTGRFHALFLSLLGALIGGGGLWLVGWIAKIFMKKEAMGLGDVKLMMMVGAWMGWKATIASVMIASLIGSLVGLGFVIKKRLQIESRIPFGPFLSLGAFIYMMWGSEIWRWYAHFFLKPFGAV